MIISAMAAAVIGGLGYRLRGGYVNNVISWFKPQHKPFPGVLNRILAWGGALGIAAGLGGLPWLYCAPFALLSWPGCTAGLWHAIDLGRNQTGEDKGDTFLRDLAVLTLRGAVVMGTVSLALFGATLLGVDSLYWLPAAAGLLEGLLYWLAGYCCTPIEGFGRDGDAPEMGEVFVGMAWGLATYLALVLA